jgi:hypothetical protein
MASFNYTPDGKTLAAFMRSKSFVKGIRGPFGSGKSVASAVHLFMNAAQQAPSPEGRRLRRTVVIRNTYPELELTTLKTWREWFPQHQFGKIRETIPYVHNIRVPALNLEWEVWFIAMDREEHVRKMLSLDASDAWINEARELPKGVVDAVTGRIDRYPGIKDGGCTYPCLLMDTNSPSDDHWWPIMSGEVEPPATMTAEDRLLLIKPDNWEFFSQPPAMIAEHEDNDPLKVTGYRLNPERENRKYLSQTYYKNLIQGKRAEWVNVYVLNKYGRVRSGRTVYENFRKDIHVARSKLAPMPDIDLQLGWDFGLTGACVFFQRTPTGRYIILGEMHAQGKGTKRFGNEVKMHIFENMPLYWDKHLVHGDPAGEQRAQTDEQTPFTILRSLGFNAQKAGTNDIALRIESVETCLGTLIDGYPKVLIDPECRQLIAGMEEKYEYERTADTTSGTGDSYRDSPVKNEWSHVQDALQYGLIGNGEHAALIGSRSATGVVANTRTGRNPYNSSVRSKKLGGSQRALRALERARGRA